MVGQRFRREEHGFLSPHRVASDIFSALVSAALAGAVPVTAAAADAGYVGSPLACHAVTNRAFTGIPSMAVAPDGRLWATWYAGPTPGEDNNNYVPLATSGDGGATWREVRVADPDEGGPRRAFDPQLWVTPDGRLFWTWTVRGPGGVASDELWLSETAETDAAEPAFSAPRLVGRGVMMGKPVALSTGEWVFPVCAWFADPSSLMLVSTDKGAAWTLRGGATAPQADRLYDEHQFLERRDGSILCMSRVKSGIRESVSTDRGATWTPLEPSKVKHTTSRFFLRRLASGNVLLVKHGPICRDTGRSLLTAYLSKDEGRTWEGGLLLDARNGVSYPDGQETPDGMIRVIYDYDRTGAQEILMASFREADVFSGDTASPSVRLRRLVSKGRMDTVIPVRDNADGAALDKAAPGAWAMDGAAARPVYPGEALFADRAYTVEEWPEALAGASFFKLAMDGEKTVRCARAGVVYLLTPQPDRNRDSQSARLAEPGFKKVALPEIRLFGRGQGVANFCTVYQKRCAAGEAVTFGKWAVPVWLEQ